MGTVSKSQKSSHDRSIISSPLSAKYTEIKPVSHTKTWKMPKKADTGGAYSIWQNAYQLMPFSAFETGICILLTSLQLLTHFQRT